ncbi:7873_t:CDS:2 [Paraglomus occultum]|uniref:7873_t:CDS:1 n=1 Tax=Paraglomus occultum TaxID=144539 RepID=A0A9N9EXM8_9GLOM|nr:7873_t:CDS:2 [Paraglomus occultum]
MFQIRLVLSSYRIAFAFSVVSLTTTLLFYTESLIATETTVLLDAKTRANSIFIPSLDKELDKITAFYLNKERELFEDVKNHLADVEFIEGLENTPALRAHGNLLSSSYDSSDSIPYGKGAARNRQRSISEASLVSSEDDFDAEERTYMAGVSIPYGDDEGQLKNTGYFWARPALEAERIGLKKRTIELFVRLSELKSFVSLNQTGFSKILKKYDKITHGQEQRDNYMSNVVNEGFPFKSHNRERLDEQIFSMISLYAKLCTFNNFELASRELKAHLREFVVWERNTVWRELIGLERKAQAVGIHGPNATRLIDVTEFRTPFGKITFETDFGKQVLAGIVCIGVFVFLLNVDGLFKKVEERNCFALLIFASMLWATEVIPLFVTSLLIPFLVVALRVLRTESDPRERLTAHDATRQIFGAMFSPVIMLLLGGFAIAAALSKYHIAKMMATFVLSKSGTKPAWVLLSNMFVATIASMWISNVAAPVLCLSLIQPILRNLPQNSPFGRCLILGIALASNVGGMASPISSPQNIVAIENMNPEPSWSEWFLVAIPLCILSNIIIWLLLLYNYQPSKSTLTIHPIRASKDPWTGTQVFVVFVTILTIVLWCVEKSLEDFLGDMGIVAILPLVAFFGSGILTKEDFNNFLWTVIILAMGGIALGRAVYSSGLLESITLEITEWVDELSVWEILVVFCVLVLIVTTFISHTVGALIILPIVSAVGASLGKDGDKTHQNLLVMGSALMCSCAMGLPISGFPNMNAIMMEDEMGVRYLSTKDFLKSGVPASVLAMFTIVTVDWGFTSVELTKFMGHSKSLSAVPLKHVHQGHVVK